ncbi:MAG: carbohydrate ABC transporter permease [Gammaproteobacteria bacterium WSBS_2016_MAG_OTU1]
MQYTSTTARIAALPAIIPLFLWMAVPLGMTLYFSFIRYNLLSSDAVEYFQFTLFNYEYFFTDPASLTALTNTFLLVSGVLLLSVIIGVAIAVLFSRPFWGQGIARILVISPFFIMPTVVALVWKNLLMHPVNGLFAYLATTVGLMPLDWFAKAPLFAIVVLVSWQWAAFAGLVLLTAMQSLDEEQRDAAAMDGAPPLAFFRYIILPHLARPIAAVVLIETIFLLSLFAEIFVTTGGGPGLETTNLAFLIYAQALLHYDVGGASAGGILAVILANIAAIFLMKLVGKTMDGDRAGA